MTVQELLQTISARVLFDVELAERVRAARLAQLRNQLANIEAQIDAATKMDDRQRLMNRLAAIIAELVELTPATQEDDLR